jgi:hypothetical protein
MGAQRQLSNNWSKEKKITMIIHLDALRAADSLPTVNKGTIQEIIGISGNLWCK